MEDIRKAVQRVSVQGIWDSIGTLTSFDRRQQFGYWWHPAAKLKSKLIKALAKEAFCMNVKYGKTNKCVLGGMGWGGSG